MAVSLHHLERQVLSLPQDLLTAVGPGLVGLSVPFCAIRYLALTDPERTRCLRFDDIWCIGDRAPGHRT